MENKKVESLSAVAHSQPFQTRNVPVFYFAVTKKQIMVMLAIFIVGIFAVRLGSETMTLITYYPAPYGAYAKFRTTKDTFLATHRGSKLGIGTLHPSSRVTVNGGMTIGSAYTKTVSPSNGLAIQGKVGIGTSHPSSKVTVNGGVTIGSAYIKTASPSNGLAVQGKVGIGTSHPSSMATVKGGMTVGKNYDVATASSDTLLVEGKIGIGTKNPQSALDVYSKTSGFLPPRMTTPERNAVQSPPAGSFIYNSENNEYNYYNGEEWKVFGGEAKESKMRLSCRTVPEGTRLQAYEVETGMVDVRDRFYKQSTVYHCRIVAQ